MLSRFLNNNGVSNTKFATIRRVLYVCLLVGVVNYAVHAYSIISAKDLVMQAGPPVGGDFVAFWGASHALRGGDQSKIYEEQFYETYLQENTIAKETFGLTWQYPPHFFFLIAPLVYLPFLPSYLVWISLGLMLFLLVLNRFAGVRGLGLLLIVCAPVVFNAVITGQNGFLTSALLFVALLGVKDRPVLAGIAAGLLTFKPQLGVLIPIAYLAGGHWKAIAYAAGTTILLVLASYVAFGSEAWQAFFDSLRSVAEGVQKGQFPIHKMPTMFAACRLSGVPVGSAMIAQYVAMGVARTRFTTT